MFTPPICVFRLFFWETKPKITCLLNSRSLRLNVLAKIYSIVGSTSVQLSNKDRHNDRQQPAASSQPSPGNVQCQCNVLGSQEEQNIFTEAMTTLGPCYLTPCTSHHRVPPKTLTLPVTLNCCLHCLPAWRAPCTVYCSNCSKYSTVPCRHYPLPLSITACDMTHTLVKHS